MEIREILSIFAVILVALPFAFATQGEASPHAGKTGRQPAGDLAQLEGQPVDIAPSAYQYRADLKPEENAPESWIALMHYAHLPLNAAVDVHSTAIRKALSGLLWEEIRPVTKLELTWETNARRKPAPEELVIATLNSKGSASSWWNNLVSTTQALKPTVSDDRLTYTYALQQDTCGIVVSVAGDKTASEFDVPGVRVLTADSWKKMDIEIEWGFEKKTTAKDYSGRVETYDGVVGGLQPLDGDTLTSVADSGSWRSRGKVAARRGIKGALLYMGESKWREKQPFTTQPDDVARTIVTLWTSGGNFSFLAADLENGPILAPEYGFFVRRTSRLASRTNREADQSSEQALQPHKIAAASDSPHPLVMASQATSANAFIKELKVRKLATIRQQIRDHKEQTWEGAVTALCGDNLPPHPTAPAGFVPSMQVTVPSERLTAQWNLGVWHLLRHAQKNPVNGRLWFDDYPYGILGAETYMILQALDLMGSNKAAEDGFDQWLSLPMDTNSAGHHDWALPDRPNGLFTEGHGCLTHAVGPDGVGGQMDGIHAFGPGSIGLALTEHYWLTGDTAWLKASAPRMSANAEWMLRQRKVMSNAVPGGEHLWCKGLQPALQVTPDSGGLWMQFYESEAYYWASISRLADTLSVIDPKGGAKLKAEAEGYRKDLRAAVERSIALSPIVPVRDGTFHSVIPFACYVRGLSTGAWGWQRDGSGKHVGPLYWETVQSAAALISPSGLLSPDDVRVQGYIDVLEDRLLLENQYVHQRVGGDWFTAGWQYQGGLERTANMHLTGDDIPVFIRSFLTCYAIDILPNDGYIFNEHAVHGPPDKIFEEAAFLERFRDMLVMEDGRNLWLARATPRAWLEQGKRITVKNAPTHFGTMSYEIISDVEHNKITAEVHLPVRGRPDTLLLRLRHPAAKPIRAITVNGSSWPAFDKDRETIRLQGQTGTVTIEATY
ncbi:MAG: hypothetical protein WCL39_10045 [Armatimonadota bacterium]